MGRTAKESLESEENERRIAEIMGRVRQMDIRTSHLVTDHLAGSYASVFKGRGMDFDRVRNYVPGDDVRVIDWNVTARTGEPFIKTFTEERELTILLMIDVSASSDFGSNEISKRELQTEIAAVLATSAMRNRDKVGLVLFTEEVELYIPPVKGRSNILRVIREALFFQPTLRGTNIVKALDFINQVTRRKAIVFLVSDFRVSGEFENLQKKLSVTSRHHDVIAMAVNDHLEGTLPDVGLLRIEDAETGETVEVDTGNPKIRNAYHAKAAARRERIAQLVRRSGVDFLEFAGDGDWLPDLMNFFSRRKKR